LSSAKRQGKNVRANPGRFDMLTFSLLVLVCVSARADQTSVNATNNGQSGIELDEIVVRPPEPEYVAPTNRDRIGRIWAPVLIDGKGPFRLVLDTGANGSAVTARTALSLGVPAVLETSMRVTGFTGAAVVPTIRVDHIEFGDFSLGPSSLPVLTDVFGGADGVLSLNGLTRERIVADFAHDRLEITRSHHERAPPGFAILPLRMMRGLPVASLRVGGVPVQAIIDTGAQVSVGNLALRDALARGAPQAAVREDVVGVTLDKQSGDRLPAPDLQLGRLTIRGMNIVFGDMYLFQQWNLTHEPTLAIGMDLLGSFDVVIIDFAQREMHVRPRTSAQ
jgi:predicted aspartyl protease